LEELLVERKLKEWEKNIKVLFDRVPQLEKLIKNPVYYSNAPWAGEVNNYFSKAPEAQPVRTSIASFSSKVRRRV